MSSSPSIIFLIYGCPISIAGLVKPSVLKPLIATIEQSRIVKTMGQLSAADQQSLGKVIQTILGS